MHQLKQLYARLGLTLDYAGQGRATFDRAPIGVAHTALDGKFLTVDGSEREADCVRHNNAGFDMQFAENLFQPFVRMHSSLDSPAPVSVSQR